MSDSAAFTWLTRRSCRNGESIPEETTPAAPAAAAGASTDRREVTWESYDVPPSGISGRSRSTSDGNSQGIGLAYICAKGEAARKSESSGDDNADDSEGDTEHQQEPPAFGRSQSRIVHDLCQTMRNPGLLYTDAAHQLLDALHD